MFEDVISAFPFLKAKPENDNSTTETQTIASLLAAKGYYLQTNTAAVPTALQELASMMQNKQCLPFIREIRAALTKGITTDIRYDYSNPDDYTVIKSLVLKMNTCCLLDKYTLDANRCTIRICTGNSLIRSFILGGYAEQTAAKIASDYLNTGDELITNAIIYNTAGTCLGEIDVLIRNGKRLTSIEIKSGRCLNFSQSYRLKGIFDDHILCLSGTAGVDEDSYRYFHQAIRMCSMENLASTLASIA